MVHLSRVPHKPTLRVFISHSASDVKFEMNERCLLFQVKHQRLNLNLEKFYIRTAIENKKFCLDIDRDPAPEQRFLVNTLRAVRRNEIPGLLYSRAPGGTFS